VASRPETLTFAYAPLADDIDERECVICDQALRAHDEPRFRVTAPYGALCADCADETDPALAAAARVLNLADTLGRRLPAGTPSVEAFFASIDTGLRTLRARIR